MNQRLKAEFYQLVHGNPEIFEFIRASSLDGMWYWDLENPNEEWTDDRFWAALGYDETTTPQAPLAWQQHIFPEDFDLSIENLQQHLIDPMHPYDQIVRFRHKNGSTVWMRSRGKVIHNDEGQPVRMLGTNLDITSVMNLSEQESLLAASTRALPVGHLIEDPFGNILDANDAIANWLGYTSEEMRTMHVLELAADDQRDRTQKMLDDMGDALVNEITSVKKQYKHKNGQLLWGLLNARTVMDQFGNIRYIVASILNIESENTLQSQLHQTNIELVRANKELDKFAYAASHDLKSPLTGIRRLTDWIYEDCKDILPAASKRHLDLLDDRVKRMEGLLDDLLAYSRVGTQHVETEEVNLVELGQSILDLLEDAKGFSLVANNKPFTIQRIPFEMVLRNLIDNAVKYNLQKQGVITLDYLTSGDEYIFTVIDDGPGIEPAYQNKVFDMFVRLRSKDEVDGSGMGLALVEKIVKSCGGSVRIESDGICGTKVVISWPKQADK